MLNSKFVSWFESGKPELKEEDQLNKAEILFPKIEDKIIEEQVLKLGKSEGEGESDNELISYNDFLKMQLKVAEIIGSEKIKKSDKLLKLKVKIGEEERQVVAGIAKSYQPEDLLGKKVVVVSNLQPAKLMGEESRGMILAVEDDNGALQVLSVDGKIKTGTRVK